MREPASGSRTAADSARFVNGVNKADEDRSADESERISTIGQSVKVVCQVTVGVQGKLVEPGRSWFEANPDSARMSLGCTMSQNGHYQITMCHNRNVTK